MRLTLKPHPASLPAQPVELWANIDHAAAFGLSATLNIWFGISAPAARFVVPPPHEPRRIDGLWQTTCFEAFLKADGEDGYREWNFAPSGDWAAYDFAGYRDGQAAAEVDQPPYIRVEDNLGWWALGATVSLPAGPDWQLGLSAVLEEQDGTRSYWALAHAPDTPDFHHPDCFAARLA